MKLKFICINVVSILFLSLMMSSCTDILDREPGDAITDENFWDSPEELKLFVNDFYPSLYTASASADQHSDNVVQNTPDPWLYGTEPVPDEGGGWSEDDWANIRNVNYFLTHYQSVEGDQNDIDQYVGEIHFFRAYAYFNKMKRFGDVPWINKDLNPDDDEYLYKPRTPRKEVTDSILADLEYAVNHLKTPGEVEKGRIHKYAALQFMARVSLYEGSWMKYRDKDGWEPYLEKAVSSAEEIMEQGDYEIVKTQAQYYYRAGDLVDKKTNTHAPKDYPMGYRALFIQEDLSENKEAVLSKSFKLDVLTNGRSRSAGGAVSKDLIEAFLCKDGLPIALSDFYQGDDSTAVEFQNRDPRLINIIDNRFLPTYMNSENEIVSDYLTPVNSDVPTGYKAAKFRSPIPEQNEANKNTTDQFIFRYAEVLLIYAEAKAELGTINQTDLDKSINKLRARLDGPNLPDGKMPRLKMNPPADPNAVTITGEPRYGYKLSPLLYEIRRERRIELAFEGFRWDDIVRWKAGKLIENPKTVYGINANSDVQKQYDNYFDSDIFNGVITTTIKDWDNKSKKLVAPHNKDMRVWEDKLYLHPIPSNEITLSQGNLEQNPGWGQ